MPLSRREVLGLGALGTLAALAGCSGSGHQAATASRTPGVSSSPATPSTTPAAPKWDTLAGELKGRLVRRGQPGYGAAHELFNPRFDDIQPQAIAYCATARDVRTALAFARESDLPFAVRSGGHSYGG